MKLRKHLNEDVIDITKKLRGDATDEQIEKVLGGMVNALAITLDEYRKDNNRKNVKNKLSKIINYLSSFEKRLK